MALKSTRDIDWSVARLSGGFTSARRRPVAHHGSLRPSDWKLEEPEEGPLSERGDELARDLEAYDAATVRPVLESLAPTSMDSASLAASAAQPPQPVPASRRHPSRAANSFWAGSAAVMSVVALGLVVKLGYESAQHAAMPLPPTVIQASTVGANSEGVPFASRPVMTLDPVFVDASESGAAHEGRAPMTPAPATRTAARTERAEVAPLATIPPQRETSSLAAALSAPVEINRPATAVAIAMAGRRAAGCAASSDAHARMPVSVTFAPSGRVTVATVDGGPFLGTSVGSCIARTLRTAAVTPFDGPPVTVHSSVRIP